MHCCPVFAQLLPLIHLRLHSGHLNSPKHLFFPWYGVRPSPFGLAWNRNKITSTRPYLQILCHYYGPLCFNSICDFTKPSSTSVWGHALQSFPSNQFEEDEELKYHLLCYELWFNRVYEIYDQDKMEIEGKLNHKPYSRKVGREKTVLEPSFLTPYFFFLLGVMRYACRNREISRLPLVMFPTKPFISSKKPLHWQTSIQDTSAG